MLLRKRAEEILDMVDKTEEEFKALGEVNGGDSHVGAAESGGIRHLARRIKAVQARYPRIRVHLYSGDRSDLAQRLEQGLLDFAVLVESGDLSKITSPCPAGTPGALSCAGTTRWRKKRRSRRRTSWMCL